MHITNLNSLFEEFKDTAAPSARDKVKSLSNLIVSLKDRSLSPENTTTTISSIKSLLDDIDCFSKKKENRFSGQKFEKLNILSLLPESADMECASLVYEKMKNLLLERKECLNDPKITANYQKIFEKSHGDILKLFTLCEADVFAQRIFAHKNSETYPQRAIGEFYDKVDMTSESFSRMPAKLSLTSFAIRKSSTKMRIIGAMAVMTHFLQTHEIENDEMLHRMEEYEKMAYVDFVNFSSQIPALIEDITCFGALQCYEELVLGANELKRVCVELLKMIPNIFKKASEVVGGNAADLYQSSENDISETISGLISFIKEIDVFDKNDKSPKGIAGIEESKKALKSAGSSVLSVVWHIIHLKPKDEKNLIFHASQSVELCNEMFFRNEHLLFLEMISLFNTIIVNLRRYTSAVYSLQNKTETSPIEESILVSQKVITAKNKVIAGGVAGLLIKSRTNAQIEDIVYSMLVQFGQRIYDILEGLPAGNQELVAQKVMQTIFEKCDQTQLQKFVAEDKSPLFIKLKSMYGVMEHSLMKKTTEVLSPIYDFLIPSQELSPFMTLAVTDPQNIANQLTTISFKMYKKLKIYDFFETGGVVDLITNRMEDLASFVCTATLTFTDFASRAFMKNLFANVLRCLINLGDFNSAFGVYSGIQMVNLDFNKCFVPEKQKEIFAHAEKLFTNSKTLKSTYKKFKVCVPYIGTILDNIATVKSGKYQYYACGEERLVDFTKQKDIYTLASEYLKYQEEDYTIAAIEPLNSCLTTLARFDQRCLDLLRQYHE
ncbi:hypothetical protein EIN_328360 [Entamoeba invadens IP1]|uniref:Ras-GEF domain-containing protein n=1 Tax=Entamoeba invadens IP1 TaxID=370355 RepID=A0A0A1TXS8_ENTIV|nr:hypothetical protein EIN_328360 [Entamoeba invadens IP1]ELP86159.1 hypothetical protein EIN_328360 [Entamoeba invadens IP1]|eukprot:XP_004185505.1 hypothetical protein EIN_328360 [Entamoeba invadens IP1]